VISPFVHLGCFDQLLLGVMLDSLDIVTLAIAHESPVDNDKVRELADPNDPDREKHDDGMRRRLFCISSISQPRN